MRKKVAIILCSVLALALVASAIIVPTVQKNKNRVLSEMSNSECIKFVEKSGIKIPDYKDDKSPEEYEKEWGELIKINIKRYEESPEILGASPYSNTELRDFVISIQVAVKNYYDKYGWPETFQNNQD